MSISNLLLVPSDLDFRPKGALLRLLSGTPASGGHPDTAAGQTPVFGRAAEACDGRCVFLRPWLIHVDSRHCSHAAGECKSKLRFRNLWYQKLYSIMDNSR